MNASTWAAYRGRILTTRRVVIAHDLAALRPSEPVIESPNQNPCAKGHIGITVRNGWLVCTACGTVLGKA